MENAMRFKYKSRKRSLITGGDGFLGSHLVDRLLELGHEALCVDNFYAGSKKNIEHLRSNPNFELIRHDVTSPLYVEVDEIYNLASPASPVHYQKDPVQTTKTSVHGAINMLGLTKRLRCPILQASTSEVYGEAPIRLMSTDAEVTGPINIGNPAECTIRELAETIIRMTGSQSRLHFAPLPEDAPRQRRPNMEKGRSDSKLEGDRKPCRGTGENDHLLRETSLTRQFVRQMGMRQLSTTAAVACDQRFHPDGECQ